MRLDTYYTPSASLSSDYVIWVHGRPDDQSLLSESARQRGFLVWDHKPTLPTSRWLPGRVYMDSALLRAPSGHYEITVGLWLPSDRRRLVTSDGTAEIRLGLVTIP
jgi:hypothetical protein